MTLASRLSMLVILFACSGVGRLGANPGLPVSDDPKTASVVGQVTSIALQEDGKLLIGGTFLLVNGHRRASIARLNQDGTTDLSFNAGSGIGNPFSDHSIYSMAVQPDGKILVGGLFAEFDGLPLHSLIRLNPNGSIDQSFGPVAISTSGYARGVRQLFLRPDGKILIAGGFDAINGEIRDSMALLNVDGSLASDFNISFGSSAAKLALDGSNWLVYGAITAVDGTMVPGIARLNAEGGLEAGFVADVKSAPESEGFSISAVVRLDSGQILVSGEEKDNGLIRYFLRRLNSDGSRDNTFVEPVLDGYTQAMVALSNGQIVLMGDSGVWSFNPDGSQSEHIAIDTPWYAKCIFAQPDDSVLLGGEFFRFGKALRLGLLRFAPDGALDEAFVADATGNNSYNSWILAPAVKRVFATSRGDFLIGGGFHGVTSSTARGSFYRLGRLTSDGAVDPGFVPEIPSQYYVEFTAIGEQSDGRIVVGGTSNSYGPPRYLTRYNVDGTIDKSFVAKLPSGFQVSDIVVLKDDCFLVAGYRGFSGTGGLRRFLPDGQEDGSFWRSTKDIYALDVSPRSEKILVGYKGGFMKLNASGHYDDSLPFNLGIQGDVFDVLALPGERSLIVGDFTQVGDAPVQGIVLLLPDGSVDSTFLSQQGADAAIRAITLRSDGDLLLTGDFAEYGGLSRSGLVQISRSGVVRDSFDPQDGLDGPGFTLATMTNGSLLVGGAFTSVNQQAHFGVATIQTTALGDHIAPAPPSVTQMQVAVMASGSRAINWLPVDEAEGYLVERGATSGGWTVIGLAASDEKEYVDSDALEEGVYSYRIVSWGEGGERNSTEIVQVILDQEFRQWRLFWNIDPQVSDFSDADNDRLHLYQEFALDRSPIHSDHIGALTIRASVEGYELVFSRPRLSPVYLIEETADFAGWSQFFRSQGVLGDVSAPALLSEQPTNKFYRLRILPP